MNYASFNNPELESSFQEEGYVYIKNFIAPQDLDKLLKLYNTYHLEKLDDLMWNSLYHVTPEDSKYISEQIKSILSPYLEKTFGNYRIPLATLMSKCGEKSDGFDTPHRDYSVLNEERDQYRQFWLPLVDVTENNGAMYVVPKSHKLNHRILPMMDHCAYRTHQEILKYSTPPITMKAGDLFVYADKTIHGGFPNVTNQERPVVHFGIIPEHAEVFLYQRDKHDSRNIKMYQVSDDFYLKMRDFDTPPENKAPQNTLKEQEIEINENIFESVLG